MSDRIATYSFLPWLRQGVANHMTPGATAGGRAQVSVALKLHGDAAPGGADADVDEHRDIALYGPGDVVGVEARAVFRTEPRNWTTNFEPNYLAAIDFYDEDMPWRYTPVVPDLGGRLQPWLALVVLEEREPAPGQNPEFTEGTEGRDKPLPYIDIADSTLLPPADQLWAWAHVHVNRSLAASDAEFVSTDVSAITSRLQSVLDENPDLAYARLLCPRKLEPNKAYHAFLIPSFESGRRAGLGLDPFSDPALPAVTTSAWADYPNRPDPTRYPVYYRFYFRTGGEGDFESLARLLKPSLPDHRLGRRDIDVQKPGLQVRGVQAGRPDLGGVLKLGGALRIPAEDFTDPAELAEVRKYEEWATPYPQPIQTDLAKIVNLADDYAALAAADANRAAGIVDPGDPAEGDPDPVITPPLYGTWHALTKRLLTERDGTDAAHRDNWVHELNLDPRFRAAAGLGTRVIQDQQEKLMNAAWEQIGAVLEANQKIRRGHLAIAASTMWYERSLRPLLASNLQRAMMVVAPLQKRIVFEGTTVHQQLKESRLQPALTSPALRRIIRPRARLVEKLPFTDRRPLGQLLERANQGAVSAAPPKVAPAGAETLDKVASAVVAAPDSGSSRSDGILNRLLELPFLLLLLLFPFALIVLILWYWLRYRDEQLGKTKAAAIIRTPAEDPSTIDRIPPSDFVISDIGSGATPKRTVTDSVEAQRYKDALRTHATLFRTSAQASAVPPKRSLNLPRMYEAVVASVEPARTVTRRTMAGIALPARVSAEMPSDFVEAMAYPEIDLPMYEPLKDLSTELLLPNINFVAQNSVTLLETNQKFIEAYMVGLNHEFARELLWREYPTDQRGSYFRQFWDVNNHLNTEDLDAADLREQLRDITRLDHWDKASALGTHNNRPTDGGGAAVVLVIRGELLKRYPTAVIYAHRARWQLTGGVIDRSLPRVLEPIDPSEEAAPPRTKVRTPLYDAKVDPDVYFFGFDLTIEEARGGDPADDPGWYFVIKERPGEPRFGLDLDASPSLGCWNDLSWGNVDVSGGGPFVQIPGATTPALVDPGGADPAKRTQFLEDSRISWSSTMSSADLAYVFFQVPVLVAIHASELLPH